MRTAYPTLGNANMQKAMDALRPAMGPLSAQVAAQGIAETGAAHAGAAKALRTIAAQVQGQRANVVRAAQFKLPTGVLRESLAPQFKLPGSTWRAFEAAELRASSQVLQAFDAAQVKPSVVAARALAETLQPTLLALAAAVDQESGPAPEPETPHWLQRLPLRVQVELFCTCLVAVLAFAPVLEDAAIGDTPSVREILAALIAMTFVITKAMGLRDGNGDQRRDCLVAPR